MPRTLPVVALVVVLVPGRPVVAGPPDGVSGRMAMRPDEVGDGLRRCQRERNLFERMKLLCQLAVTKDARVAVVLGDSLDDNREFSMELWAVCDGGGRSSTEVSVGRYAAAILHDYYLPPDTKREIQAVQNWWKKNEADMRRRAKQLP